MVHGVTEPADPGDRGASRSEVLRREPLQLVAALALGSVLAAVLLGGAGVGAVWRVVVLPVALLLIVRGLIELVKLGRAEWRREVTGVRAYLAVIARFVIAYFLVVAASS
jgi:hypothetical protein